MMINDISFTSASSRKQGTDQANFSLSLSAYRVLCIVAQSRGRKKWRRKRKICY